MKNFKPFYLLSLITLFCACEKNAVQTIDTKVTDGAQVRFFNFGVGAPTVNYYANQTKLTATLSSSGSESAVGLAYGSVFPANGYNLLAAGQYTLAGIVPSTATTAAGKAITSINATLENNKFYSVYSSGIYNATTQSADGFLIEDVIPATDLTTASVRFVNAISNSTPLDFVIKNTTTNAETKVVSALSYKSASAFIKIPFGVYDISIRSANSAVSLSTRTAQSLSPERAFTITARGDVTVTGATAVNRPFLDNTINR